MDLFSDLQLKLIERIEELKLTAHLQLLANIQISYLFYSLNQFVELSKEEKEKRTKAEALQGQPMRETPKDVSGNTDNANIKQDSKG